MSKKKGLIIGTLPASIKGIASGGIATHIEGLMTQLNKNGIEIKICYHKPFGISHSQVLENTRIQWLKCVIRGFIGLLKSNFPIREWDTKTIVILSYYYGALSVFLKHYTPDFIHVHSLHNPASILLKHLGYGDKIIVTDHGFRLHLNYLSDYQAQKICKATFESARNVIYISDIYRKFHEESCLGDLSKLVKISNPTDFDKYPLKGESSNSNTKKTIIFNGYKDSLNTKGLLPLLQALSIDKDFANSIKLIAICNDEAKKYIRKREWPFEYELIGPIKFQDVLKLYTQSDLLCTPSRFESFGLVYTEALAVGLPIVGYFGTVDEFKETLNTYLGESVDVETDSVETLLVKIKTALATQVNRNLIRQRLIDKYGWKGLFSKFYGLYYPNE